ncbi:MAG: hypothetical protein IPJ65_24915 [Archangiaceae bacterium]|nr:hypothetical protein [Archangiaceae bacterium]
MPEKPPGRRSAAPVLESVSRGVSAFRWVFMPLGLLALVAVGVHAAADSVDDRLRWVIDQLDAALDGVFADFEFTRAWVDAVGSVERTHAARGLAFLWELAVDVTVALPALGYLEESERAPLINPKWTWSAQLLRLRQRPTPMRVIRPVATGVFAVAGAYAIARMVESSLYLALRSGIVPDGINGPVARIAALGAMVLVLASLGWRAVLRALQHADQLCEERGKKKGGALTAGLIGSALALPLALAAAIDTPWWSFFR